MYISLLLSLHLNVVVNNVLYSMWRILDCCVWNSDCVI